MITVYACTYYLTLLRVIKNLDIKIEKTMTYRNIVKTNYAFRF